MGSGFCCCVWIRRTIEAYAMSKVVDVNFVDPGLLLVVVNAGGGGDPEGFGWDDGVVGILIECVCGHDSHWWGISRKSWNRVKFIFIVFK